MTVKELIEELSKYPQDAKIIVSGGWWAETCGTSKVQLLFGSIAKLIGRELTWKDEPVEIL